METGFAVLADVGRGNPWENIMDLLDSRLRNRDNAITQFPQVGALWVRTASF
jgi:hypothetical protein